MQFSHEKSETLRRLVRNCLLEAALSESDLAWRISPWISHPTLNRILKTEQQISEDNANALIHFAGQLAALSSADIVAALGSEFVPRLRSVYELTFCKTFASDREKVSDLLGIVASAEANSRRCLCHSRILPGFTLEEDVAEKVVRHHALQYSSDPRKSFQIIRDIIAERRETFMNDRIVGTIHDFVVIITLSNLIRMVRLHPPFSECSRDEINACLESLIYDSVLERKITVAVINDIPDGPARRWAWANDGFGLTALYDSGILVKRKRGTLACRVIDASANPVSQWLIDQHRQELLGAMGYACHSLGKDEIAAFLSDFLVANRHVPKRRISLN